MITGGAGFIGSCAVLKALEKSQWRVLNIDKLTYSGNLDSLASVDDNPRYSFIHGDISDPLAMQAALEVYQPDAIMHLAAESHVDRSIDSPEIFIETNIKGTFTLLETARHYWKRIQKTNPSKATNFRFLHVSTDEVFGDLADNKSDEKTFFNENTPYAPSSPYSASKAASDHLVRAWQRTYGFPALITNCSNNYGPRQFPEKLIPLTIINALAGKNLPIYGKGEQIRDWLYVEDHVEALLLALAHGQIGATYTIGGRDEKRNVDVVRSICGILEDLRPQKPEGVSRYENLIEFVKDRPGHDGRYAIDPSKISNDLGWHPQENFESGLRKTVVWYLENKDWWQKIIKEKYQGQRLGQIV